MSTLRHPSRKLTVMTVLAAAVVGVGAIQIGTGTSAAPVAPAATAHGSGMHHTVPAAAKVPETAALPRTGWTASAPEAPADVRSAAAVLDGSAQTAWRSVSEGVEPTLPESLVVDMGSSQSVSGLVYTPAPSAEGRIGAFQVALSDDGKRWQSPAAIGTWADDGADKTATFATTTARFVRLTALSEAGDRTRWVSAAEIGLLGRPMYAAQANAFSARAGTAPACQVKAGKPKTLKAKAKAKAAKRKAACRAGSTTASPPAAAQTPSSATTQTAAVSQPTSAARTTAASTGSWSSIVNFPIVPAAAAMLPNNRVLLWSAAYTDDYSGGRGQTQTAILDLTTMAVSPKLVSNTKHDMFCPGVAILADGRVMVTGGNDSDKTSIYDPKTDTWVAGPVMNVPRGYQSMTTLPDGSAFTIGGSWSGGYGGKLGEVWMPSTGWRTLDDVPADPIQTADPGGVFRQDNHAWLFPVSGGRMLQAGPSKQMNWITTKGSGSITPAGLRGDSQDAMNGNAVMYDTDRLLTTGGATAYQDVDATRRTYTVDLRGTSPQVTRTGDTAAARAFANSVVLPDGTVLTLGGQPHPVPFTDTDAVLTPELWDPATGQWRGLAPAATPRTYHSWALLLPDGRVISGGGGLCGWCATNHANAEIFTPPYLLNADGTARSRPSITRSPTTLTPGSTVTVTTDRPVSGFAIIRDGDATHSVNNDQRRVSLPVQSANGTTYTLKIPADGGIVLPGPWMLFALDAVGTPSVSTGVTIPVAADATESLAAFSAPGTVSTAGTANLALGKSATQSSTAFSADAGRAVDGRTDGAYPNNSVTHTDTEAQPWWQVDLGAVSDINAVRLWNRTDCCADRLSSFYVFTSNTDMRGRSVAQLLADTSVTVQRVSGLGGQPSATVPAGSKARYVRIQLSGLTGASPLSLAEVQVLGTTNLALGKPASQPGGNAASLGNDGNTNGNFFSGSVVETGVVDNPWWQVDLGASSTIHSVQLWKRSDCCLDRLSKGTVFIGGTDMSGRSYASLLADTSVKALPFDDLSTTRFRLPANGAVGRYVKVQNAANGSGGPLDLAEAQVFGMPGGVVTPVNTAPVADAGRASMVATGSTVALDGSASSDADGNPLTYRWSQTGGPSVALTGPTTAKPTFLAPASAATLTFALVVNDGRVDSSAATVTVSVVAPQTPTEAVPLVNLAQGRTASQSSVAFDGWPARAVDGNTGGNWANGSVTHTGLDDPAWWQVDLGAQSTTRTVTLFNRTDCCADRLANGSVFLSATDMTGKSYAQLQADTSVKTMTFGSLSGPSVSLAAGDTRARFVRVQLSKPGYLSLAEVQVLGPNLAQGKQATQSSTAYGALASRGVDGNTDGNAFNGSITHTDAGAQPWWQVDLAAVKRVDTVTVWNRTECCTERLANAVVLLSATDMTGRSLSDLSNDPAVTKVSLGALPGARTSVSAGVDARYVRVQLPGTTGYEYLHLAEVQVNGRP